MTSETRQLYYYQKYGLGFIFFILLLLVKHIHTHTMMMYKCFANALKSFNRQYLALNIQVYQCQEKFLKMFSEQRVDTSTLRIH